MDVEKNRRQALLSWGFLGVLIALSAILAGLQYRWIGEVSRAERERLRESLQVSLRRLSQDFNTEVTLACTRLIPEHNPAEDRPTDEEFAARYLQWRELGRHTRLFRQIAVAQPEGKYLMLKMLNLETGALHRVDWPADWEPLHQRLQSRLANGGPNRRGPGFPGEESATLIDLPYFGRPTASSPQPWRELEWVILDVNLDYVREAMLPEFLQRHLGTNGNLEYDAEVVLRDDPTRVIFASDPARKTRLGDAADGSVALFEVRPDMVFRRSIGRASGQGDFFPGRRGPGFRRGGPEGSGFDRGRWELFVRHRAGSLEALVARARKRNIAISAAILLLILAAMAALLRFTRRAQKLAQLQMEFVAGVSHELRTPLSVMRTAGHNLQGRVANDPARVQRYGALIEEESEKLTAIVEQVLRFANVDAGRVIGAKEVVAVDFVIGEAVNASRRAVEEAGSVVDEQISPDLPAVLGDPTTLRHAIQNLVMNAAKYGRKNDRISVSAAVEPDNTSMLEIRVSDHGDGIAPDELGNIFEPFYRGKKAIEDQIHGTGLGLSLAKRIVEAHGGTISVESERGKGATFVIRLPALPLGQENELANSIDRG